MQISSSTSSASVATSVATAVRRAQPSDAGALAALVNRAYEAEAFFVRGQRTTAHEVAALIGAGEFLVLEGAGGICAAVLFQGPGERDGVPPSHAYFGMLSVLPELQGMGLGLRLVRLAEAMAEAAGAAAMSLRVINLREELGRWYRSLGYREVGTAPYIDRRAFKPCHFVVMEKLLAPSSAPYALGHSAA